MIIIGYPGIGKSSVCGHNDIIDLESTFFHKPGDGPEWAERYCNVALDLSKQGYTVCVSSHPEVLQGFWEICKSYEVNIFLVFPAADMEMEKKWIQKLEDRYYRSRHEDSTPHWIIEKNYRAWDYVSKHYMEDTRRMLLNSKFYKYVINVADYDLNDIIEQCKKIWEAVCNSNINKQEKE